MRGKEQFLEYFFQRSSTLFPFFFFLYFKYSSIRQQMYSFLYFCYPRQQKRRLSNGFNIENDFVLKNGNRSPNFSLRKAADNDNSGEKTIVLSQLLFVTVYFLLLKRAVHSEYCSWFLPDVITIFIVFLHILPIALFMNWYDLWLLLIIMKSWW